MDLSAIDFETTLRQIRDVRESAEDPRTAYLIRSRLRRALLSCARQTAKAQGVTAPKYPGTWKVPEDAPADIREIAVSCGRIYERSQHLCQPSESFDVRWEQGWASLDRDLDRLEDLLRSRQPPVAGSA
jgi:hypothetical protein